ncbi:hypothetical protein CAPTEDRAFT_131316, partial [Capitella teleta]
LTLKLKKCKFGEERMDLLGYSISQHGITPQEDKVAAIRDMEPGPLRCKRSTTIFWG